MIMRTRRHDAPGAADDFDLETNDTFLDIANQLLGVFAWVVLGLGSIALVVGGVVIMNIMLVSVTERTREIGVRKALGARQRDVLLQFLIESASMAMVGGAIGVLGGVLVGKLITIVVGFPTAVPVWAIFLGLFPGGGSGNFLWSVSGEQGGEAGPGCGVARGDVKKQLIASVASYAVPGLRTKRLRAELWRKDKLENR